MSEFNSEQIEFIREYLNENTSKDEPVSTSRMYEAFKEKFPKYNKNYYHFKTKFRLLVDSGSVGNYVSRKGRFGGFYKFPGPDGKGTKVISETRTDIPKRQELSKRIQQGAENTRLAKPEQNPSDLSLIEMKKIAERLMDVQKELLEIQLRVGSILKEQDKNK